MHQWSMLLIGLLGFIYYIYLFQSMFYTIYTMYSQNRCIIIPMPSQYFHAPVYDVMYYTFTRYKSMTFLNFKDIISSTSYIVTVIFFVIDVLNHTKMIVIIVYKFIMWLFCSQGHHWLANKAFLVVLKHDIFIFIIYMVVSICQTNKDAVRTCLIVKYILSKVEKAHNSHLPSWRMEKRKWK